LDYSISQEGILSYSYEGFVDAKRFVFRKWCEQAVAQGQSMPADLSGACKYGSLFMHRIFGGSIRGHYQHQFNLIEGRIVDLSHDAMDVGVMRSPYLHDPEFFLIPEQQASLAGCVPRIDRWVDEFLIEQKADKGA
jgi:hypothetical protein